MYITLKNLMEIPLIKKCKLVAGENGINNSISWPYIVLSKTIVGWVSGHEIAIYAKDNEISIEKQTEVYINLLKEAHVCHISAIIILVNQNMSNGLPNEVIELGNQYNIPILAAPWEIPSIDFTKAITNYIIEHQSDNMLSCEFVRGMILGSASDRERNLFFMSNTLAKIESYFLITFHFENNTVQKNSPAALSSVNFDYIEQQVKSYLSLSFSHLNTTMIDDSCIYILNADNYNKKILTPLLSKLCNSLKNEYPSILFHIGVSRAHKKFSHLHKAYREALITVKYTSFLCDKKTSFSYADEANSLFLLSDIPVSTLKSYHKQILGNLIHYDNNNEKVLLASLKCYIKNGCNLAKTSEFLYIHKNTLRYRIKKIEELTGKSLHNANHIYDITTALIAGDMLDIS